MRLDDQLLQSCVEHRAVVSRDMGFEGRSVSIDLVDDELGGIICPAVTIEDQAAVFSAYLFGEACEQICNGLLVTWQGGEFGNEDHWCCGLGHDGLDPSGVASRHDL